MGVFYKVPLKASVLLIKSSLDLTQLHSSKSLSALSHSVKREAERNLDLESDLFSLVN